MSDFLSCLISLIYTYADRNLKNRKRNLCEFTQIFLIVCVNLHKCSLFSFFSYPVFSFILEARRAAAQAPCSSSGSDFNHRIPPKGWHAFQRVRIIAKCDFIRQLLGNIHNNFVYLIAKFMPPISLLLVPQTPYFQGFQNGLRCRQIKICRSLLTKIGNICLLFFQ
jgi:hypothetical protein